MLYLVEDSLALHRQNLQCLGNVSISAPCKQDAETVGAAQNSLGISVLIVARRPDHKNAVLTGWELSSVDNREASRDIVPVEDAGGQDDDSFDEVISQKPGADE